MRLFIAIQLSDEMKKALVGYMHDLKKQGVEGNQKLAAYVKELRAALSAEGVPYDTDKFIPHITLIRKFSAKNPIQTPLPKADMMVKKASLMKSEQKNGKVSYREL